MKITLTDRDGIKFDVEVFLINTIREKIGGAEITLDTGEVLHCKESAITVYQLLINTRLGLNEKELNDVNNL